MSPSQPLKQQAPQGVELTAWLCRAFLQRAHKCELTSAAGMQQLEQVLLPYHQREPGDLLQWLSGNDALEPTLRRDFLRHSRIDQPSRGRWQPLVDLASGGMGRISLVTDGTQLAILKERKQRVSTQKTEKEGEREGERKGGKDISSDQSKSDSSDDDHRTTHPLNSGDVGDAADSQSGGGKSEIEESGGGEIEVEERRLAGRFRREVTILQQLNDPYVIRALDSDPAGNWLVLDYHHQGDLAELTTRRGTVPIAIACGLLSQVAQGLATVHAHGLIHRDLKPANIFLHQSGRICLADFGIAKLDDPQLTQLTMLGMVVGSPQFMAPEQAQSALPISPAADIYAAGLVLYTLLAGEAPFRGAQHDIIYAHRHHPLPNIAALRPDCPPALKALLETCCAKKVSDRPADGAALQQRLRQFDCASENEIARYLNQPISRRLSIPVTNLAASPGATTEFHSDLNPSSQHNVLRDASVLPHHQLPTEPDAGRLRRLGLPWFLMAAQPAHAFPAAPSEEAQARRKIICWSGDTLILGKQRHPPVHCCLRRYPVESELQRSKRISRAHLRLQFTAQHLGMTDLHSANGTRLDGVQLLPDHETRLTQSDEYHLDVAGALRCRLWLPLHSKAGQLHTTTTLTTLTTTMAAAAAISLAATTAASISMPSPAS